MTRSALIIGGELRNKGAQAMSFITVSAVRKYFPELEPVLVSGVDSKQGPIGVLLGRRTRKDLDNFRFQVVGGGLDLLANRKVLGEQHLSMLTIGKRSVKKAIYAKDLKTLREILSSCAVCFDISGFAFGAHWGYDRCQSYLTRIQVLKEHGVPLYILPQSFGPFVFHDASQQERLVSRAKALLTYPRMVCARERQGYEDLLAICSEANCALEEDMVLQGESIKEDVIFFNPPRNRHYIANKTDKHVAIVPNAVAFGVVGEQTLVELYKSIIDYLIDKGYTVHIVQHAENDRKQCALLKNLYKDNRHVALVEELPYCFQYEELFNEFDFVIASRFHSIVHAYRSGTPCISLGWAVKYKELMERFGQGRFVYDVRQLGENSSITDEILKSVCELMDCHNEESDRIIRLMNEIRDSSSAFERVAADYRRLSQC